MGTTSNSTVYTLMVAALCRKIKPRAKPSSVSNVRYTPAISTARSTGPLLSEVVGTTPEKMRMPIRKVLTHTISLTTSIEAARTNNLANTSRARFGTAASVVRIAPDAYSLVIKSDPMTPTANWASCVPPRLVEVGSNVSLSLKLMACQCPRTAHANNTLSPMVNTTNVSTPMMVERTVRNLIHSDAATDMRVVSLLMMGHLDLAAAKSARLRRKVYEDVLERGSLRSEFEHGDARLKRRPADLVRRE